MTRSTWDIEGLNGYDIDACECTRRTVRLPSTLRLRGWEDRRCKSVASPARKGSNEEEPAGDWTDIRRLGVLLLTMTEG